MTDENERPATRPELLRQVADWLDLTDPIVAAYMRSQPESEDRDTAIACVEGREMQADLRALAEDMKDSIVPFDTGGRVTAFYMVPEWTEGGREAHLAFHATLKRPVNPKGTSDG